MKYTNRLLLRIALISIFSCCLAAAGQQKSKVIRLATYQYGTNTRLENLAPLAKSVGLLTGHPVETKSYPNIEAFTAAIKGGQVDIGLISTMGYLLLRQDSGPQLMEAKFTLSVANTAIEQYKTAFVVPAGSPLTSEDLLPLSKYIHLGLVSSGSTSGYLVPRLIFAGMGLSPLASSFEKISYLGSHKAAIDAVANGKVDLAALGSAEYFNYIQTPEQAAKVKLMMLSEEIPLGPVLFNKNLKKSLQKRLNQLFLVMHLDNKLTLSAIKDGWTEARDAEKYIAIDSDYYDAYLNMFTKSK